MRSLLVGCAVLALLGSARALQGGGDDPEKNRPYRVGYRIQDPIVLADIDGGSHDLFEDHENATLVVCFWAMRDPIARRYEKRLAALRDDFAAKNVVFYLVDPNFDETFSPRFDPLEKLRKYRDDRKIALPILVDEKNAVADAFGALTSNHVFVVDGKRFLRYAGGIDNDPEERLREGRLEWLRLALEAVTVGELPEHMLTRPKGRRIRRRPEGAGGGR